MLMHILCSICRHQIDVREMGASLIPGIDRFSFFNVGTMLTCNQETGSSPLSCYLWLFFFIKQPIRPIRSR